MYGHQSAGRITISVSMSFTTARLFASPVRISRPCARTLYVGKGRVFNSISFRTPRSLLLCRLKLLSSGGLMEALASKDGTATMPPLCFGQSGGFKMVWWSGRRFSLISRVRGQS